MKYLKILFITSILGLFMITMPGCNYVSVRAYDSSPGYGPPPHAPARGYRQKYHGYDLEYDSDLGAYIVLGMTGVYFIDGIYYRPANNGWYYSDRPDSGWHTYRKKTPPGKLYKLRERNKKSEQYRDRRDRDRDKWDRDRDREREGDRDRDRDRDRDKDRDRDRDRGDRD